MKPNLVTILLTHSYALDYRVLDILQYDLNSGTVHNPKVWLQQQFRHWLLFKESQDDQFANPAEFVGVLTETYPAWTVLVYDEVNLAED